MRGAAVTLAVAMFLSVSGAFGTDRAPLVVRLGYWLLALSSGVVIGVPLSGLLAERDWLGGPVRAVAILTVLIGTPLVVVIWLLSGWVFLGRWDPAALPDYALPVFIVTAGMSTLNVMANREPVMTHAPPAGAVAPPAPVRFLERLPPRLRGARLLAVQAEDHYLRLHTDRGSDLILMRLSDAVAELDGLEGAQTHRSWWVAKDAVADADRSDGRAVLTLTTGVEAPVSRTYAKALREAGWF